WPGATHSVGNGSQRHGAPVHPQHRHEFRQYARPRRRAQAFPHDLRRMSQVRSPGFSRPGETTTLMVVGRRRPRPCNRSGSNGSITITRTTTRTIADSELVLPTLDLAEASPKHECVSASSPQPSPPKEEREETPPACRQLVRCLISADSRLAASSLRTETK